MSREKTCSSGAGDGKLVEGDSFKPMTLEQHWNGEFLKSVRRKMMKGEKVDECEICTHNQFSLYG